MADTTPSPLSETARGILAEVRNRFINQLNQSILAVGLSAPEALAAMRSGAAGFFDDMAERGSRPGFSAAAGLTASRIQLVDDAALELSIRLDEMARRLFDQVAASMGKVHARFITLLNRPDLHEEDLPVGANCVRAGVDALLREMGGSLEQSVATITRLTEQLSRDLPLAYAEINELLAARDIQAARIGQSQTDTGGPGARRRPPARRDDPLSSLQQAVFDQMLVPMVAAPAGGSGAAAMPADGTVVSAALLEKLLSLLDARQEQATLELFPDASAPADQLKELTRSGELAQSMRGQDAASLDVLSRLFEAMFNDGRLPEAIKSSIARLQIPLLKVAIVDPAFFADRLHPARALLDTMAMAAAGLAGDASPDHPVCREVRRVAMAVQAEFRDDIGIFSRYAAELEAFVARRDHELLDAVGPWLPLARDQEQNEIAVIEAQRLVRSRDVAQAPRAIADFIEQDWRRVLARAWLAGGESGQAWHDARLVMEDLLWSVQAKVDAGDRARLATLVPSLLRRIHEGLHGIGVRPQERAAFFDACFGLQTAALRGQTLQSELGPGSNRAGDAVECSTITSDGHHVEVIRLTEPTSAGAGALVAGLQPGDWVEFKRPDGAVRCGCLAWIGSSVGLCLFVNPDWTDAVAVMPAILERQLANGDAQLRDAHALFDSAADRALRSYAAA
jgi:hypothetical protein